MGISDGNIWIWDYEPQLIGEFFVWEYLMELIFLLAKGHDLSADIPSPWRSRSQKVEPAVHQLSPLYVDQKKH